MGGQVVDTQSAEEFMRETLENVSRDQLIAVAALLDAKASGFAALLGTPGQARELPREDLRRVLRSVFSTRRKADAILDDVGPQRLGGAIDELLHGDGLVTERFTAFDAVLADHPEPGFDLPSELLHFTAPDRWWLWTRWMWDPRAGTGSLPLVTTEDFELDGQDRGETYLRVGEAMAFVNET
ncbi:MAG TPA: hypothetical protein VEG38_10765, partial [Acidimicrobiia bacterium]|nr:hypothetical protein [Acidimicrobiia bacterium]